MPTLLEPIRPFRRALVVAAHPDDAEFGAAGTIARLVDMGTDVRYVVVTDGASGSDDPTMTRERLAGVRELEQRAAANELDPSIRWTAAGYINHPDHRAVGDLVLHSINPAASTRLWDTTLIDEGLEPWDVAEVWFTGFGSGNVMVDITQVFGRKLAALRAHASQLADWDPEEPMRTRAAQLGSRVDRPLCEAFTVLRLRELDDAALAEPAATDRTPPFAPRLR